MLPHVSLYAVTLIVFAVDVIVLNDSIISLHSFIFWFESIVVNFYRGTHGLISWSIKTHVYSRYTCIETVVDDRRINHLFLLFRVRSNTLSNGKDGAKSEYEIGDLSLDRTMLVIGMCNFSCISDTTHGSRKRIFWTSD